MHVRLASETDLDGFRREARRLLAGQVPPAEVTWSTDDGPGDLLAQEIGTPHHPPAAEGSADPVLTVPARFLALCESVVLHHDPQRFTLLYRLLWRLAREPGLREDPLDPDMLKAQGMGRAVQQDIHKMRAFVRFRPVERTGGLPPLHVAWFEPRHRIVEANGAWFSRRFAHMHWALLTPDACIEWNGQAMQVRGGARREDAPPPDAGEALWLTYYRSIFNPARLNLPVMRKEMPLRYWRNLPEAQAIAGLAAAASARTEHMIQQPPSARARRIPLWEAPAAPASAPADAGSEAWDMWMGRMQQCRACPIGAHATQAVPGEGPLHPAVMLVGEQPGDQEDLHGRPFVGPAGQLLDRAFARLDVSRASVFMSNAVRHFKFELRGKRRLHKTPSQQEALACQHWLDEEVARVRPGVLVALGATAARALLGRPIAILDARGCWFERDDGLRVLVTVHPAWLLRLPAPEQPAAFEVFVRELGLAWTATAEVDRPRF